MPQTLRAKGYITKDGELKVLLPEGWQPGEVEVTIAMPEPEVTREIEPTWTAAEVSAMMQPHPRPGAEIVERLQREGGWEAYGIADGADWVQEQRSKRREQRTWQTDL